MTINSPGVLDLNQFSLLADSLSGSGTITSVAGPAALTIGNANGSGTFAGSIAGQITTLTKAGTGTESLSGNNSYTGVTYINNGILSLASSGAIPSGGTNGITFGGGTLQYTAASAGQDYSGNIINSSSAISIDTNGSSATFAGVLNGSNSGGLTKLGAGLLTLDGSNTYTGTTTLSAGTVNLGSGATPGVSGPLGNSPAINPGSIVLGGGWLQYSNANQNDYSGRFSTAPNQSYNVDINGQTVTWGTALTSSGGSLNMISSASGGLLMLTAANTYGGLTTVNGGTLQLGSGGSINSGNALTTGAGGTFDINGQAQTLGLLSNSGTVTSSSSGGTLTIGNGSTGAGAFTGAMNVIWNQGTASSTLSGGFSNNGNLTLNADGRGHDRRQRGSITWARSPTPVAAAARRRSAASIGSSVGERQREQQQFAVEPSAARIRRSREV